jgi:hypothetical protein
MLKGYQTDCGGCVWRSSDDCRACRAEESIKIAEQIGTASLVKLHKPTLLQKIKRFIQEGLNG